MADAVERESLEVTLRKHSPSRVRMYDGSESPPRDLVVPQRRRKRWDGILATLDAVHWVRLELCDAKGGILAVVDNDQPATELEDLPAGTVGQVERHLGIILKAQREALTFRDAEVKAVLQGQAAALQAVVGAVLQVSKLMQLQVEAASSLAAAAAAGAPPAKTQSSSDEMLERLMPMILAKLMGTLPPGKPAAPPNGVKS